jgi:hypothetical protein
MGYYYDHVAERWHPIDHDRKLSRTDRACIDRRAGLIEALIVELERGRDSVIRLYVGLAARTLATSDEILCRKYGEQIAALTGPDEKAKKELQHKREERAK